MQAKYMGFAASASLIIQGCSSSPRVFSPILVAKPADQAAFASTYAACNQELVAGKLDSSGRLASAGAGAAASASMAVAGGAAASSAGLAGGMAVASATIVLLPFVALGGAFGLAKMKRAKKEKAVKKAMEGCLHERGFAVAGWEKVRKRLATAPLAAR